RLGRPRCGATGRGDDCDVALDQVGRQRWQSVIVTFRPSILDGRVLTVDVAGFLQTLAERGHVRRIPVRRCAVEKPDYRHRRLLRPRRERPSGYTAADKCDEFPPPHGAYPKAKDHGLSIANLGVGQWRASQLKSAAWWRALGTRLRGLKACNHKSAFCKRSV